MPGFMQRVAATGCDPNGCSLVLEGARTLQFCDGIFEGVLMIERWEDGWEFFADCVSGGSC